MGIQIKIQQEHVVIRHKARKVAQGYSQKEGIHFNPKETFAPVAHVSTLRLMIARSASCGRKLYSSDVKTAFLNAKLDEELYMKLDLSEPLVKEMMNILNKKIHPFNEEQKGRLLEMLNIVKKNNYNAIVRLLKTIYGLKQSGRKWNEDLDRTLKSIGFEKSQTDRCLYRLCDEQKDDLFILVWVDDIIFDGKIQTINNIVEKLRNKYELDDVQEMKRIIGINIQYSLGQRIVYLDQSDYIYSILGRCGMKDCKPCSTPMGLEWQNAS